MVTNSRPFAEACEQNKQPILEILKLQLAVPQTVLEIGSGTGQHAIYFARELPHLTWQPSDLRENLAGIKAWMDYAAVENVRPPIELDVADKTWLDHSVNCIYTANSLHIMSWNHVIAMFSGIAKIALPSARIIIYGPFNYNNQYTSESNRQFDFYLRSRDPQSGVRNFEDVDELAKAAGFNLLEDYAMPANNRTLIWQGGIESDKP